MSVVVGTGGHGTVRLAYESFGPDTGEPLLLMMGLDSSMRWWPDGFCLHLAERGFRVVRFDYRDVGRSSRVPGRPGPRRGRAAAPYALADLAGDAVSVLDGLGLPSAHLVGHSLGAGVALGTALYRPERVRTVSSISGLPRGYRIPDAARYVDPRGLVRMLPAAVLPQHTREQHVRGQVALARKLASPRFPFDERWARLTAQQVADDGPADPGTAARQLAAMRADGGVLRHPERISVPLLALHGADDPLLRPGAAAALARAVPDGRAVVFAGMGHEVPSRLWTAIADEIVRNADRAGVLRRV